MTKHKTRKSYSKRFKIKKGAILKRQAGQDHFNVKESGKITRNKRRDKKLDKSFHRLVKEAMG